MTDAAPILSLVLPVYNQGDHIAAVIRSYQAEIAAFGIEYEIIMVVNGSRDDSEQVCQALADGHRLRCVSLAGQGWGLAVRAGLAAARGSLLGYTNSARTQPSDLRLILAAALRRPKQVTKALRHARHSPLRRLGSRLYNWECNLLLGTDSRDINGTPKIFPRDFDALSALQRNDDLIDLEFMLACRKQGYAVAELAIHEDRRHGGQSTTRLGTAMRLYWGALRFRFGWL